MLTNAVIHGGRRLLLGRRGRPKALHRNSRGLIFLINLIGEKKVAAISIAASTNIVSGLVADL